MQTSIKAHPSAIIAADAVLIGDINIGANCIIHPRASILATAGPIELGDECSIEELVVIEHAGPSGQDGSAMRIGKGNQFQVGCREWQNLQSPTASRTR